MEGADDCVEFFFEVLFDVCGLGFDWFVCLPAGDVVDFVEGDYKWSFVCFEDL